MEALIYKKLERNFVQCNLCHHKCVIKKNKRGICNVRENKNGQLLSLVYGNIIVQQLDPIEKKPLFHFYPGSITYSIATVGCNFKCKFCQNSNIAQLQLDNDGLIAGDWCNPETIVEEAEKFGCRSIAYTYTEPTIYFEYAYHTAKLAKEKGIKNIFITNGYMTAEALTMIHPYLDAANVDLKAFNDDFYKTVCSAKLKHVKNILILMKSLGIYIEITTLIIPGFNDNEDEMRNLIKFIVNELGNDTPWHISRFYGSYKMKHVKTTSVDSLVKIRNIGLDAGLKYVYIGNVLDEKGENTYCYNCGEILINRSGYHIGNINMKNSKCIFCHSVIDGVGL